MNTSEFIGFNKGGGYRRNHRPPTTPFRRPCQGGFFCAIVVNAYKHKLKFNC